MGAQLSLLEAVSERDRILEALAANHGQYLAGLRAFAREHALRHGDVTIDAVRAAIERYGYPMPAEIGADERVFGSVFRSPDFVAIGQQPTSRTEWAARVGRARSNVTVYQLRKDIR